MGFPEERAIAFSLTNIWVVCGQVRQLESVTNLENRTITALAWDGNASSLWVGTDLGLFRLVSQDNG
ncbi:MAG: hypothetical protein KME06_17155 [Kastovskya adunca ATA6-11-RM4]|nr:hypothetical protein [Kastovskya adunca ATA6-11-RM4]